MRISASCLINVIIVVSDFAVFLIVSLWSKGTIHHRLSRTWILSGIRDYMLIFIFSERFFRSKVSSFGSNAYGSRRRILGTLLIGIFMNMT